MAAATMRTSLLLKPSELGIDLLEPHLAVRLQRWRRHDKRGVDRLTGQAPTSVQHVGSRRSHTVRKAVALEVCEGLDNVDRIGARDDLNLAVDRRAAFRVSAPAGLAALTLKLS
jgi:hypothetical protein